MGDAASGGNRETLSRMRTGEPVEIAAPIQIKTPRLTLRPLRLEDREDYLAAVRRSRADLDSYISLHREGEDDERMFLRQFELGNVPAAAAEFIRLVGVLHDGRIAGGFNLNAISRGLEWKADITWWLDAELRGQGLATEGVNALLDFALADLPDGLGLHEVNAWITPDNAASQRLARRVGLVRVEQEQSHLQTGRHWAIHDRYRRRAGDPRPS